MRCVSLLILDLIGSICVIRLKGGTLLNRNVNPTDIRMTLTVVFEIIPPQTR
jgi:hypothetical protein